MRFYFYIVFLFLFIRFSFSDEAFLDVAGGAVRPVLNTLSNVSLDSEIVTITLEHNHFSVDAEFYFYNLGKTEVISVGFPKYSYGYYGVNGYYGISQFKEYETWVNDIPMEYREIYGEIRLSSGMDSYHIQLAAPYDLAVMEEEGLLQEHSRVFEKKWLIKNVVFKEKNVTSTRVYYSCPYGNYGFTEGFEYLYGTGKFWKGNIIKAKFIIINESNSMLITSLFEKNIVEEEYELIKIDEQSFEIIIRDFKPKENATLYFHFGHSNENWFGMAGEFKKKMILKENLQIYSKDQLRIIRNTIFAHNGRIFKSPDLDKYFKSQFWYKPNPTYNDSLLNDIELTNIRTIREYEQTINKQY